MNQKKRILIVEDEFITLDMLRDVLESAGYEISGDAMRAEEAIEILERFETDIAVLDINLKGGKNGIWLAEQIRKHYHIPFIFLTANSDSTTVERASNTNPYGYLVKPFTKADVFTAIEVALKNHQKEVNPLEITAYDKSIHGTLLISQHFFIKDNTSYKKIKISDITYIQSFKNYLELYLTSGRILVRTTLQKMLEMLPSESFKQVHRSFIVNIRFVEEINPNSISIGEHHIPISKSYREAFIEQFKFFE
ncbi:MAG: response regulator [Rhodothermia bacterium]|nr:response regulator [Rhodothermia bacterium]